MADVTTARGDISPTVVTGTRGGTPTYLDLLGRKGGSPGGGVPITPPNYGGPPSGTPANPPPTKGGTPIDRPWDPGNPVPPGTPTTPPPNPNPPAQPPTEYPTEYPQPGNPPDTKGGQPSPGPTPSPLPDDSNFSKGQVRNDQMPGDIYSPTADQFYGSSGFNPYFSGYGPRYPQGQARTYDPLGIGADAYTNPDASYYGLEGVNSVLQPTGGARWGVVGGNGGYGIGMVGPDYTGPQFDDPRDVVKAMRKQRRALNNVTQATYGGPGVVDGPGGFGPETGSTETPDGGSDVYNKGGQPAASSTPAPAETQQQQSGKGGQPPQSASGLGPDPGSLEKSLEFYLPSTFNTSFGQLVTSSTGNNNLFKVNGSDGSQLYGYDPNAGGWQVADRSRETTYADPNQYAAQAGGIKQEWQKKNGLLQGKVGTGAYS